jgi:hypothetical protein
MSSTGLSGAIYLPSQAFEQFLLLVAQAGFQPANLLLERFDHRIRGSSLASQGLHLYRICGHLVAIGLQSLDRLTELLSFAFVSIQRSFDLFELLSELRRVVRPGFELGFGSRQSFGLFLELGLRSLVILCDSGDFSERLPPNWPGR